jgi:hypothetical protein
MATRLQRRISLDTPALHAGQRGGAGPPQQSARSGGARIRSLAVFNPMHYMELPELFMEFISSMTGKSPSTTGAGSEGALTKGPFNALPPIIDLNAALVSFALTDYDAFISAAGYIGPKVRVDHDISLLIPEVWCRMTPAERQPAFLIDNGYFEKCEDFDFNGKKVLASRLGYRMTASFVRTFFGRVFNYPFAVFTEEMLRPEKQDMAVFADGVDNIVGTHQRVAESYFADGSIEMACPPLKACCTSWPAAARGARCQSSWFSRALQPRQRRGQRLVCRRLEAKQRHDIKLWRHHATYLENFLKKKNYAEEAQRLGIPAKLESAWAMYHKVKTALQILPTKYSGQLCARDAARHHWSFPARPLRPLPHSWRNFKLRSRACFRMGVRQNSSHPPESPISWGQRVQEVRLICSGAMAEPDSFTPHWLQ